MARDLRSDAYSTPDDQNSTQTATDNVRLDALPTHTYHQHHIGQPALISDMTTEDNLSKSNPGSGLPAVLDTTKARNTEEMSFKDERDVDDDDGASENDTTSTGRESKPLKITERRAADIANFQEWKRREQLQKVQDTRLAAKADTPNLGNWNAADEAMRYRISQPKEYQIELYNRAWEKNTIAVLPTGSGKTFIGALLLRRVIEQELEDRSNSLQPRISFFLVDKVSLVYQQWKVLRANLSHGVAKFHGELRGKMCTKDYWEIQFNENMVIVCTAAILLDCLHHSYFRMNQINILVFDEAHHAKKNHPYARIIKDFYIELAKGSCRRPRILGLTASPVDANTDLDVAAAQLEGLLQSQIATAELGDLTNSSGKETSLADKEERGLLVEYVLPYEPYETALYQKLDKLIGKNEVFRKLFAFSKASTRELGRWCADRVWHMCLTPAEISKEVARTGRNILSQEGWSEDARKADIQDAYSTILNHHLPEPTNELLSGKVISLLRTLRQQFRPGLDKCIIFVEQRLTANILTDLIKQPSLRLDGIIPGALVSLLSL
jgi:endoribonuclease Dicer